MSDVDYQVVDGLHIFVIETSKTLKLLQADLAGQNESLRELCWVLKGMNKNMGKIPAQNK